MLVAKVLVPLVVLYFIGRTILADWESVRQADWEINPLRLAISFALCSVWWLVRPGGWRLLLNRFGHQVPAPGAYWAFWRAELSRYVPGAIWQYVTRILLAKKYGVPAVACLVATFAETVLITLAALPPAFWRLEEALPAMGQFQRIMMIAFPIGAFILVNPWVLNKFGDWAAKRRGREYTPLKIRWIMLIGMWAAYVGVWLVFGVGVAFFVRGILDVPADQTGMIASAYALAWMVAIISIIAPAGMGVRDAVFGLLLAASGIPKGLAFTVALAFRLWVTALELFWNAVAIWFPHPELTEEELKAATEST